MAFSSYQLVQGILSTIWVLIALIIGIRIIIKARKLDRKDLIAVGLTYICLSSAWWGVVVQFFYFLVFGIQITDQFYLFISHVLLPVGLFCWIYAFSLIIMPFQEKKVLIITLSYVIIWLGVLFLLLVTNLELVGSINPANILDSSHGAVERVFVFITLITFLLSGSYFSIKSMRLDDVQVKWKGLFLFMGWILLTIGALLDALIEGLSPLLLIITRLILIGSSFLYYFGFFLPGWIKRTLIK
ncbi:MAG: conserved membrane protein of unknown function [Promethearchaeota archaeon]|nr:MAG: conserved membrane protein of unknown function [Candidatus Lokiarchaeota archaeon]